VPREIVKRPYCQKHQPKKEKGGETKNAIDHFPLGNEVHEVAGHQRGLADGDESATPMFIAWFPKGM
jgi:hypothetical protein